MGIEQQVGWIEAQAQRRLPGALNPPAIELAGPDPLNPSVPVVTGAVPGGIEGDAMAGHGIPDVLEQAQLHGRRPPGVEAEIGTTLAERGAQGGTASWGRQGRRGWGHGVGRGGGGRPCNA